MKSIYPKPRPTQIIRLIRNPNGAGFIAMLSHNTGLNFFESGFGSRPRSYWRWYAAFYRYVLQEVRYGRRAKTA